MKPDIIPASPERIADLHLSLSEIQARVQQSSHSNATLVAVSKYKPAGDILACYEAGQRDFGENYVQELVDKAEQLPPDIRWHFIGTLQSNKAKILASIPNLHTIQTLTSAKAATSLNKALPIDRSAPLNILLQVNTSGEDSKSGLAPLTPTSQASESELVSLAKLIISSCPRLHFQGLMTIGSLTESLASDEKENQDFTTLKESRDTLKGILEKEKEAGKLDGRWGDEGGHLVLSMGMSSDFEAALKAGSDIVRVGTGIFGERQKKGEI
ncbi:hypothetical protein JAAARDRAFT_138393 [Jaapia argillacea MUCL 33604]|uniref:Pyridoxal phosphate homeostasis protein n=1 Tax=Jaapia argillacea MUCL 33604 TaxID=933084 RepID=A0A067PFQ6_9AGAM|nr:hypothetical protein JAAARDRAFT_138393 [Jaapia argillacea MUCL 33604]